MVEAGGQSRNWLASPLIAGLMRLQLVLGTPFHGYSQLCLSLTANIMLVANFVFKRLKITVLQRTIKHDWISIT